MVMPKTMRAMLLTEIGKPLRMVEMAAPWPTSVQLLIEVKACGVCRTDLHVAEGELPHAKLPLILGHEIAGTVIALGNRVTGFAIGDRVGVPWLGGTDGTCRYCVAGKENLCDRPLFTGYTLDGGYAELAVADFRYCYPLPDSYEDTEIAPLLCAGLIGYRSYRMAGQDAEHIGFYGFGAAAHLLVQVAVFEGRKIYAFTRPGDEKTQEFARRLGAVWAGSAGEMPPVELDAAIIFAPVGALVPAALRATAKGGRVVCGGIHMSDIPSFPYRLLWEERSVFSVANLTREDGVEFLGLAPRANVRAEVVVFPLEDANLALDAIKNGSLEGAAVLKVRA